jgi:hypothetical protein
MKVWIGTLESSTRLVEEVERILRSQGHQVSWRSYGESPNAAKTAELIATAARSHEVVVCLFETVHNGVLAAEIQRAAAAEPIAINILTGPDAAFQLAAAIAGKRASGSDSDADEDDEYRPN